MEMFQTIESDEKEFNRNNLTGIDAILYHTANAGVGLDELYSAIKLGARNVDIDYFLYQNFSNNKLFEKFNSTYKEYSQLFNRKISQINA